MGEKGLRVFSILVGVVLVVSAGFLALGRFGWPLVSLSYDLPFFAHQAGTPDSICIVYLDELEDDLLDRGVHANLLDELREAEACVVAYDIIFDSEWDEPEVDETFAESIRRFENSGGESGTQREVFLAAGRATSQQLGVAIERLVLPTDLLLDAAEEVGGTEAFGVVLYEDESFQARRLTTGTPDESSLCWRVAQSLNPKLIEKVRLRERWINFAGPPSDSEDPTPRASIPSCSVQSVLKGEVSPAFFRNKVVFVGGAPGIVGDALGKDLFAAPYHRLGGKSRVPLMSGVELQANMTANLIQENWLRRTISRTERYLIIGGGILFGSLFTFLRPFRGVLLALVLILAFFLAGTLSIHFTKIWFPWTAMAFCQVPVALVWGTASRSYVERHFRFASDEEKRRLGKAFEKYLSPAMLQKLVENDYHVNLGGEKVNVAVMFTDIADFTKMSENLRDPATIVANLNDYFDRTSEQIRKSEGTVIKFIGDAIFAGWGAPIEVESPARQAIKAALEVEKRSLLRVGNKVLPTRLGIHMGEVLAGNIGGSDRFDYTFIGDAVNVAARLESLNKQMGTTILTSGEIVENLNKGEFALRRLGRFQLKGKKEATEVFEVLGERLTTTYSSWLQDFEAAQQALEVGDLIAAKEQFMQIVTSQDEGDGPCRFFLELLEEPHRIRDGVILLDQK